MGKGQFLPVTTSALTPREKIELETVTKTTHEKLIAAGTTSKPSTSVIDSVPTNRM